jgi:hypothetical protein
MANEDVLKDKRKFYFGKDVNFLRVDWEMMGR